MIKNQTITHVPTAWIGPIYFKSMNYLTFSEKEIRLDAPLATYETTLFYSVNRGVRVFEKMKTLKTTVISDMMTRSLLFEATSSKQARDVANQIIAKKEDYQKRAVKQVSNYAQLIKIDTHIVDQLIFLRFAYETSNASGHNMTTFASDKIAQLILEEFDMLKYVSVSANYCTDKKNSSVNAILGRGKHVVASLEISRDVCQEVLKTTPEKIVELNIKKNYIGSIISGGVQSANAHFANMLLAFYIATGQDGANIVEGSQGITYAEVKDDALHFSVTLPNIIVGSVGHGKDNLDAQHALEKMGCTSDYSALKLAQIAAALVCAGELSLLSALTNQNELTNAHRALERKQ